MFPFLGLILGVLAVYTIFKIIRRILTKPNFKGKTVWITGSSSGIGQYLAYEFSRLQANLIISARNTKQLERVKSACAHPQKVKVVRLDMTDYSQIQRVSSEIIAQLESKGQKLDVLLQNAGVSMRCLFKDYHFNNHLDMQKVNVHGPYKHIQCCIGHMIKNKSGQIVGITSAAGKISTSHRSSYAGSKHAFIGILDSLRTQLAPYGIKVANIMPGYVYTNLSRNALTSGQGQKLGFTDQNIQKGLKASDFAQTAAKAIYLQENQLQISGTLSVPFGIFIRNVCPDLAFFILRLNAKSQAKALANKYE